MLRIYIVFFNQLSDESGFVYLIPNTILILVFFIPEMGVENHEILHHLVERYVHYLTIKNNTIQKIVPIKLSF